MQVPVCKALRPEEETPTPMVEVLTSSLTLRSPHLAWLMYHAAPSAPSKQGTAPGLPDSPGALPAAAGAPSCAVSLYQTTARFDMEESGSAST